MSFKSKVCFMLAFLLLVISFAVLFMTGQWLNLNSVLIACAVVLVGVAIVLDIRMYWDFFTMRTTKHGMNMGMMIILSVTFLVCVNYLANKHNKTWDLTTEKVNSLAEQSTQLLKEMKDDLEIKVFYTGPESIEERTKVKQILGLYQDYSSKVKVRYINAYVEQEIAMQYLTNLQDRDQAQVVIFFEYAGKKIRVEDRFDESSLTAAMIKATRKGESKIYFIQGHGEKDLGSSEAQGLSDFDKALKEASFQVETLNLIEAKEIPADAKAVAVIGPSVPYFEHELQALRAYLGRGGRLFLALDPGLRHNLANLTKSIGVQFENNYVVSMLQIVGQGPATVIGRNFDPSSTITRSFPSGTNYAIFPFVSEVKAAIDKAEGIEITAIVQSDDRSFTTLDLAKPPEGKPKTARVTLALDVKGTLKDKKEEPAAKAFQAVVFGDSDFLANRILSLGVNRDLAVNAMAGLTDQADLLSIRPKVPKGTMMVLTQYSRLGIIIALMALPLLLLVTSGVLWFRRRGA